MEIDEVRLTANPIEQPHIMGLSPREAQN
jgi:hypothetical protein